VRGTCERDWREHEEFFSRKISVPSNPFPCYLMGIYPHPTIDFTQYICKHNEVSNRVGVSKANVSQSVPLGGLLRNGESRDIFEKLIYQLRSDYVKASRVNRFNNDTVATLVDRLM